MQYIKKIVKKPNKILQQIYFRLEERQQTISSVSKLGDFIINHKKDKNSYYFSRKLGPIKVIDTKISSEGVKYMCKVFKKN